MPSLVSDICQLSCKICRKLMREAAAMQPRARFQRDLLKKVANVVRCDQLEGDKDGLVDVFTIDQRNGGFD